MRITVRQLRQLIREQVEEAMIKEADEDGRVAELKDEIEAFVEWLGEHMPDTDEKAHKLLDLLFRRIGERLEGRLPGVVDAYEGLSDKGILPKVPRPGSELTLPDMTGKGGRHPKYRRRRR